MTSSPPGLSIGAGTVRIPLILAGVFFLGALLFYGRHLDFPATYHPDESKKVRQAVDGKYNFHHPMLLLVSARAAATFAGRAQDFEFVKRTGRMASVVFAAGSVGLLALLVGWLYGPFCGAAAGVFLLGNAELFELAHYFKEDPALLFGLSLSFVAITAWTRAPSASLAALAGAANAVAASGKYVGFLIVPFCIVAMLAVSRFRRRDLACWAGGFLLALAVINLPAILSPEGVAASFSREMAGVAGKTGVTTRAIPHGVYSNVYWSSSTPVLVLLLGIFGLDLLKKRFQISAAEAVIVLFPVVFVILLSFSPKTHHRYFLPCATLFACLSAAGLKPVLRLRHGAAIGTVLVLASTAFQLPRLLAAEHGFSQDHRAELNRFVNETLPRDAVLLEDQKVDLAPGIERKVVKREITEKDSIASLRAEGFTHVIVSPRFYGALFMTSLRPQPGKEATVSALRKFYETLFQDGELLREWRTGDNIYLTPAFRIYAIGATK
ncbi:MAG: hypothetical protein WCQ16_12250 [Verrucomicrobiae bacterium]